jgi:hypothetical protein
MFEKSIFLHVKKKNYQCPTFKNERDSIFKLEGALSSRASVIPKLINKL